jgi:tetratricopeptide (TPR) repeat protein
MMSGMPPSRVPESIPTTKKVVFAVFAVVVFFAFVELVLALVGVRPVLVEEDPYVGFSSSIKLFRLTAGGARLETAPNKLAWFNYQVFPASKAAGTVRVFTLGGSTTYGRPFEDTTSFSGWLRAYLRSADPTTRWEVINAGGISYASYRVVTLMEELVEYEPDLFIIYSGNNEFLEKRTYGELIEEAPALTRTRLLLQRSRLWALGRRIAGSRQQRARQRYELSGEVEELLDSSAGLDYYHRDTKFSARVFDHYVLNLRRMVGLARAAGAEVILMTIPVNEKDFAPFKSQHRDGLGADEEAEHARLLERAASALEADDVGAARDLAAAAVRLDPLHAEGHYLLGRAQLRLGLIDGAASSFERAIVEDVCPLRAQPEINRAILEVAREGAPLVDCRRMLKQRMADPAGHSILGEELFLDHVHPRVEVNGLLARALVDRLREMGLAEVDAAWHDRVGNAVETEIISKIGPEDYARAHKNLSKVLIWAGKTREAERYVAQAEAVLGGDWELRHNAGVIRLEAGDHEGAIASFREATRLNPEAAPAWDRLGSVYSMIGELDLAIEAGRRAVELDPIAGQAWNNLGVSYALRGDADEAFAATRRAVDLDPNHAEAHNNLGILLFDRGELDSAATSFRQAIELRPAYAEAITNHALVLAERGRFREALEGFETALRHDSGLAAAHFGRGQVLAATGDVTEAIPSFRATTELEPFHVEAWESLGRSLGTAGRLAEAAEAVRRGIEANPRAAPLRRLAGAIAAGEERFDDAERHFAAAVELEPETEQAWIDLAQVHLARGEVEAALEIFERALAIHEGSDQLQHRMAVALLGSGRIEEGVRRLEKAVRLNPENAAATLDLALVSEHLGRRERALELYRLAARLDPALAAAHEGARRLEATESW